MDLDRRSRSSVVSRLSGIGQVRVKVFSDLMKFFTQLPIESTRLDDDDSVFEDAAQVLLTFPLILPLYNSSIPQVVAPVVPSRRAGVLTRSMRSQPAQFT